MKNDKMDQVIPTEWFEKYYFLLYWAPGHHT